MTSQTMTDQRCYLCDAGNLRVIRRKLRYGVRRDVTSCGRCGIVYLEPRPDDLREYYRRSYRQVHSPALGKVMSSAELFETYLPYQRARIDRIRSVLHSEMVVLDVGCSAGHFLYALKDQVKECIGLEYNEDDAEFVEKTLGIRVYTQPLECTDLPVASVDLVTVYHVLEHVQDPLQFLRTISRYIRPGGVLCIEVPNINDALLTVYKVDEYEDFWYREPHVFYFSPATLSLALEKAGFAGSVSTFQDYNIVNQMRWLLTRKPGTGAAQGMAPPVLVERADVDAAIAADFNKWIRDVDESYKNLLSRHGLGDAIHFIGSRAGDKS